MYRVQQKTVNSLMISDSGGDRGQPGGEKRLRAIRPRNISAAIGLLLWASLFLLTDSLCWIQALFGVPCIGCGSTRAALALFHGYFSEAFTFHPLIPLALVILPYAVLREFLVRRWPIKQAEKVGAMCVIALFIVVYVIRMIMFFPHTEPMVPVEGALWPRFFHWIMGHISK